MEEVLRILLKYLESGLLTQKQYDAVFLRYGFEGDGIKTLREVGGRLGVSTNRVYQILYRAMLRLRYQPDFFEAFNKYLVVYPLPKEIRRSGWFTKDGLLEPPLQREWRQGIL